MITAIETIRSVARRAVEDPTPPADPKQKPGAAPRCLLPRLVRLVMRLFAADSAGIRTIYVIAEVLAAFLPLFDSGPEPPDAGGAPGMSPKEQARVDLLRQERASRAGLGRIGMRLVGGQRARPDRPPAMAPPAMAPLDDDARNEFLDLISQTLETFIRRRDANGIRGCLCLLDLLADTFDAGHPEAA